MKTRFHDWRIDGYTAKSPDGKYHLWVGNGFWFFADYRTHYPKETLLAGISLWTKYRIWREFCRERRKRASDFLSDPTDCPYCDIHESCSEHLPDKD